jgi:hypothetical protein
MSLPLITELRRAAEQARVVAERLTEQTAKQGFVGLAVKWESEADELELKNAAAPFHGLGSGGK